jgi:hypothetical protein
VILITSAALVTAELRVEVGRLPSAFVPLGNRRLYEHQAEGLQKAFPAEPIFISLPDDYQVCEADRLSIERLGIHIVWIPAGLTLGNSLIEAIDQIGHHGKIFRVLHGDTYLRSFPTAADIVLLAEVEDPYLWEIEYRAGQSENGWCGFFTFSDSALLRASLLAHPIPHNFPVIDLPTEPRLE